MILGKKQILGRVKKDKLIENFEEECLEGAGYDLRLGKFYEVRSKAELTKDTRELPGIKEITGNAYVLKPGEYILIETHEKLNMSLDLVARMLNRSSLFRCGCTLANALVDPGFKGTLTMGLYNMSKYEVKIGKMARIGQIVFETVDGETEAYQGRYQHGKVV